MGQLGQTGIIENGPLEGCHGKPAARLPQRQSPRWGMYNTCDGSTLCSADMQSGREHHMRSLLVACTLLIQAIYGGSPLAVERDEGEIALSVPGSCDVFVVSVGSGFSLLHSREHYSLYEGDVVRGALWDVGDREVEIVGETTLAVTIEQSALTLEKAAALYRMRCERGRE